ENAVGSDVTYIWQSGPSSTGPWTDFGGNTPTQVASQTASTWYQCVVTCNNSSETTISTPVEVAMDSYLNCYCAAGSTFSDETIGNVTFGTINNTTTSFATYENFTAQSTNILQGTFVPISVTVD